MAELGEELRRERVRRNLTFKDIEQVLHIKTTYLEAIEDGNYAVIPGREYVEHQMAKRRMSLETRQKKRQRSIEQERIMLAIIAVFMVIFLIWLFLF